MLGSTDSRSSYRYSLAVWTQPTTNTADFRDAENTLALVFALETVDNAKGSSDESLGEGGSRVAGWFDWQCNVDAKVYCSIDDFRVVLGAI